MILHEDEKKVLIPQSQTQFTVKKFSKYSSLLCTANKIFISEMQFSSVKLKLNLKTCSSRHPTFYMRAKVNLEYFFYMIQQDKQDTENFIFNIFHCYLCIYYVCTALQSNNLNFEHSLLLYHTIHIHSQFMICNELLILLIYQYTNMLLKQWIILLGQIKIQK